MEGGRGRGEGREGKRGEGKEEEEREGEKKEGGGLRGQNPNVYENSNSSDSEVWVSDVGLAMNRQQ